MLQPIELKRNLPITLANGVKSTTGKVWEVLLASKNGDLQRVQQLERECPELLYAQYNYTPPIHFAVREGHTWLVAYLLEKGAHDPGYRIYPFQESLQTLARDRGYEAIASLLDDYTKDPSRQRYRGDNGEIDYQRSPLQQEFEQAVNKNKRDRVKDILDEHPEFAKDETYFWSEGILLMPAKGFHREMIELLMQYGARVPSLLKWAQFYYFERHDSAAFLMSKGMDPNTRSWHHVSLLHDMAQKGKIREAELLITYGADLNAIDEEYQSTPLGMAVRWGQEEMADYLIRQGADCHVSGALWSTPLAWAQSKGWHRIEARLKNLDPDT